MSKQHCTQQLLWLTRCADMMGGFDFYYDLYFKLFERAGFSAKTPLYLASGIFSYSNDTLVTTTLDRLRSYSSAVFYKVR